MSYCRNCGSQIDGDADLCLDCGVNQSGTGGMDQQARNDTEKYCVECGASINRKAEICPECGVRQPDVRSDASTDKIVAGIFALLLGSIGVHKFYQGNVKYGVLYLCFFWTGIPALLGLIEGILMLVADDAEYERRYADGAILGKF